MRSDLTVGVGGRAVGAGDLALGVGRREGLEVGVGELDGLRIWPRRRLPETRGGEAREEMSGARVNWGIWCLPGRIRRPWGRRGRSSHRRTSSWPATGETLGGEASGRSKASRSGSGKVGVRPAA